MTSSPYQNNDPGFLDLTVKDFDLLDRMHKQGSWTDDQERHFRAGWQAAMEYYRPWLKKRKSKK